jgi:hypothetical protein
MRMREELQAGKPAVASPRGKAGQLACLEFSLDSTTTLVSTTSAEDCYHLQRADRTRDVRPDLR